MILTCYLLVPNECHTIGSLSFYGSYCRLLGSLLIVFGLYMVVWGKSRDQPPENQNTDVELATET